MRAGSGRDLRCWPGCRAGPARAVICIPMAPLFSLPAPVASGRAARGGSQASAIPRGSLVFTNTPAGCLSLALLLSTGGGKGGRWSQALLTARAHSVGDGGEGRQAAPNPTSAVSLFPACPWCRLLHENCLCQAACPPKGWCWRIQPQRAEWWGAGRGLGWFGEMGVHPRTGVLLPPFSFRLLLRGLVCPHVPNEALVPVAESHRDPAVLQQVGQGPWGQDAAKMASSFTP